MKRPLAYITAAWYGDNEEQAARYCRAVYEAGFSPICPTLYMPLFLNDAIPEEHKSGMHITNEFVTSAVNTNHAEGLATWCYFDEFHILLRDPLTASYFVAVWKMLRKKGCVPSALTQNVKDLLASREIEAILDNTDFMILLSQAQSDRAILAKQPVPSAHLHYGRGSALPVCPVYGGAGQPPRPVPIVPLCGKVHRRSRGA